MTTQNNLINGKYYPLWQQFVDKKAQWIGGVLEDEGDSIDRALGMTKMATKITDISLVANGEDSAFFEVHGGEFSCGFDTRFGGVVGGEEGWITFSGYGGHKWRIKSCE